MSGEVRQRRFIANYLNVGKDAEKNVLLGTGAKTLDESPSAQAGSKRYVNSKSATQRINGYEWTSPFELDQIRSEDAVDFICNIGEKQLTGGDAETEYTIVDLDKKVGDTGKQFQARRLTVAIQVEEFSSEDGEVFCNGNLLGVSDLTFGVFDTADNTFTPGE